MWFNQNEKLKLEKTTNTKGDRERRSKCHRGAALHDWFFNNHSELQRFELELLDIFLIIINDSIR